MHSIEWAAGLFEGEGNIYKRPNENRYSLTLAMNDEDVVDSFHELFPMGKRYVRTNRDNPLYVWQIENKSGVQWVLNKLLPFFHNRRAYKALNILDDLELA